MRIRARAAAALGAALGCAALLAGCAPGAAPAPHTTYTQVPVQTPTQPPAASLVDPGTNLGGWTGDPMNVYVDAVTALRATAGCGCSLTRGGRELYPKGSYVIVLKAQLYSSNAAALDAKGMTFQGTKYAGRADLAVLDTKDGPKAAAAAGLPWLPEGAWAGKAQWLLPGGDNPPPTAAVAAAYYVPAGAVELDLKVSVPGQEPLTVQVAIPEALQQAAAGRAAQGAGQ